MRLSDLISNTILEMLNDSKEGEAEIKRNELAGMLGCVPSQINYVLSSRFTPEQGFVVESRRGGGGYIKITRIHFDRSTALAHVINSIGDELSANTARVLLENLAMEGLIDERSQLLIAAATSDKCYQDVPQQFRNKLRSSIFKQLIICCV